MARTGKRGREESETYNSDGGFVSNDDGNAPKKKSKKAQAEQKSKIQDSDEKFWELSAGRNPRRVAISDYNKTKLINIREFYEKNDEYLPAKKGISLTIEQYQAFLKVIPEINADLQAMGIDVYGKIKEDEDSMGEDTKPKRRVKAKETKANIEATSDEDEE